MSLIKAIKVGELFLDEGLSKAMGTPYSVASLYDYYKGTAEGSMEILQNMNEDYKFDHYEEKC